MKSSKILCGLIVILSLFLPLETFAQAYTDVTSKTYEKSAIDSVVAKGWMKPLDAQTFGYGKTISPQDWLYMLMFLRTDDACPELGYQPNQYWTADNIRACLEGAGVTVATEKPDVVRRDEAMQQLFSLRRKSFAFQQAQTKPAGYIDPGDLSEVQANRQGAMIAADRLKLIFRTKNKLLPASPLLREDAALSVWRFHDWEQQGGVEQETQDRTSLGKEVALNHWRDLDTDIYVISVNSGGDAYLKPILPYRSFNPATSTSVAVRDEYVYEPVSSLAKESGALAAINGSYFNVQWPWGALEDEAILDGKTLLERTDRSTFVVCADGKMNIGTYNKKNLAAIKCTPKQALGAGPLFMSKGQVLEQSTKEGFDEYTLWERRVGKNARTAIAVSVDRKTAYVIIVAGKSYPAFGRGGSTLGTFLKDKYPDIGEAMMFDGGNSTALYANNSLLVGSGVSGNTQERNVVSALGIFSKAADKKLLASFKKQQATHWDSATTTVKIYKPDAPFTWQQAKNVKAAGLSGQRGSAIQIVDAEDNVKVFNFTFDLVASDATSTLTVARREGLHEKGWKIPTEIHVLNPKDKSDVDVIKLLSYLPERQKPDLKTFDAIAFRKSGVVFGDATGRYWFYYAKDQQLSPAKFLEKPKTKPKAKTAVKTQTASKATKK